MSLGEETPVADSELKPESSPPIENKNPGGAPRKRDPVLIGAVKAAGVTTLVLTVLMALIVNVQFSVGTLIGGLLATVNLILFIRLGEAWLAQKGSGAPWGILGALKLLGLFACVFIILRQGAVSALAFVIGYGALPIGIAASSLFRPASDEK
ncbi:MAG: hypothetical protein HOW73_48750 [Polyangiaceae bacterium]|nr:hypothetical protein [Polyangiaceae bacterium]